MSRCAGAIPLGFISGAILLAACVEIPTGADDVLSLEIKSLPSPSVVAGDTLRDSTGLVAPVRITAFNFSGEEIATPAARFFAVDAGISVDSLTGIVRGDSVRTSARILVSLEGLNATVPIAVTLRPDTVTLSNGRDSLSYSLTDTTANVSPAIGVKVLHGVAAADSAVVSYFVSFRVVSPTTAGLAQLVDDNRRASSADTTDAGGIASRRIKLDPAKLLTVTDSVIVEASVKYRGVNIKGSPAKLVLKVKPK